MNRDITNILIKHINELCHILEKYAVMDKQRFVSIAESDIIFQKAVLMSVGYIGELSKKTPELIKQYNPNVNWRRLGTSRNIIFHDYDIVDMEIIASVIFKDINTLKLIKEVDDKDILQAIELVENVFTDFVAIDYSETGINTFFRYTKEICEKISSESIAKDEKIWACYQNGKIIGVIATRNVSHITLLFVDGRHHRKGIARYMLDFALGNETEITVNSSPYAVKAYERLGFIKTDEQQEKDGIIFTPMKKIQKN